MRVQAIDPLNLSDVFCSSSLGYPSVDHAFVTGDTLPDAISLDISLQYSNTQVDVVFNSKDVDTLFLDQGCPGGHMHLHDTDGTGLRNRERIAAAFDKNDAGDK